VLLILPLPPPPRPSLPLPRNLWLPHVLIPSFVAAWHMPLARVPDGGRNPVVWPTIQQQPWCQRAKGIASSTQHPMQRHTQVHMKCPYPTHRFPACHPLQCWYDATCDGRSMKHTTWQACAAAGIVKAGMPGFRFPGSLGKLLSIDKPALLTVGFPALCCSGISRTLLC
jgi:hypothetical protein